MSRTHAGIREITIENFRGLESLHLSFVGPQDYPNQVVVLGGPNGTGKTSVLEACLLAAGYTGTLQGKKGEEAIRQGANDYQLSITLQVQSQTYSHEYGSRSRPRLIVPVVYFSSWRAPGLIGPVGITAGRRGRRPDRNESNRLWNIKQFLVNARAHELFPSSKQKDRPDGSRFEAAIHDLNHVWNLFYPDESFSVEPVADDPDEGFDVFLYAADESRLSVEVLSSGQIELFSFAGALIMEEMSQGLIFVDEPELHLDPQWHRQLLRALQYLKPDSQLLVATHSPEIYDSVRSFERHFLAPANDPRVAAWRQDKSITGEID